MAKSHQQIDAEILSNLDIQAEYQQLGVRFSGEPRASGKVSCYAVGREDNHPSAWVDINTGRYGDSGGNMNRSMSLWDFAATYGDYPDWLAARKEFAKKAGVKLSTGGLPENLKWRDRLEFQSWDDPGNETLAHRWCVKAKKGVTVDAIKSAGGMMAYYPCFRDKNTGELKRRFNYVQVIALPAYENGSLDHDPCCWVIWDCTGAKLEVFRGKGIPPDHAKMLTIGPSSHAMMGLNGLQVLADDERRKLVKMVWKTAGPTDMMGLISVIPSELRDTHLVITNASGELGDVSVAQAKLFAGLRANVVTDANAIDEDAAGKLGELKWCHALNGIASEIWRCNPSKYLREGKDLRDFLAGMPINA